MTYLQEFWQRRRGLLGVGLLVLTILLLTQYRVRGVEYRIENPKQLTQEQFASQCTEKGGDYSEMQLCAGPCFAGYQCGMIKAPDAGRLCSSDYAGDGKPFTDCWACYYGSKIPTAVTIDDQTYIRRYCNEYKITNQMIHL